MCIDKRTCSRRTAAAEQQSLTTAAVRDCFSIAHYLWDGNQFNFPHYSRLISCAPRLNGPRARHYHNRDYLRKSNIWNEKYPLARANAHDLNQHRAGEQEKILQGWRPRGVFLIRRRLSPDSTRVGKRSRNYLCVCSIFAISFHVFSNDIVSAGL